MRQVRQLLIPSACLALGLGLEFGLLYGGRAWSPPTPDGPATLAEVARLAEHVGLYARSDRCDGTVLNRLIVSDRPVSFRHAANLRFNNPRHPCWSGLVAVCYPWQSLAQNYEE